MNTKTTAKVCIHCGSSFRPTSQLVDFCCAGCQFVHDLIVKNDLGQFYDLHTPAAAPVKSLVFQRRDYSWLSNLAQAAETQGGPVANLELDLQGVSCLGCVWLIEKVFLQIPGALSIHVDHGIGRMHIRWQSGTLDVVSFARTLQSFGYLLSPSGKAPRLESRALVSRIGVCGALAMNTMLFTLPAYLGMRQNFEYAPLFSRLALFFSTVSFIWGGSYFFSRAWHGLRNRVAHIDLPISLGLTAAYAGSLYAWLDGRPDFVYFDFVAVFVLLMLTGRWMQQTAIEKNRNRLLGMQTFIKESDRELERGQSYFVDSGQVVPVRSKLLSSVATLGLEWINGESDAGSAREGQIVTSGAVNLSRDRVALQALESWPDSILWKLIHAPGRGRSGNTGSERFIKFYIVIVIALALAGFAGWMVATHQLLVAIQVMVSVLVVSCPCASGFALPLAEELTVSTLRNLGVFVREQSLWSRIIRVRKIIFDKTGTLTLETLTLRNPEALQALPQEQKCVLLHMVADNLHPVSGCLRENLLAAGVSSHMDCEVIELPGLGLSTKSHQGMWRLGRPSSNTTGNECEFALNNRILARFSFGEEARADAVDEVALLQKAGYTVHILSGDRAYKVAAMARHLDLPDSHCGSEMSPEEKARLVRRIDDRDTLMIGDGANDSLAFNESWCRGTPAIDRGLLEQKSDFYFLGRGIKGVRELLEAGKRLRRTTHRVIAFATAYNACAILLSLAGHMNPLLAAILMPASSLVSIGIVYLSGAG